MNCSLSWATWLILLEFQTAIGGGGGDIVKKINHGGGDVNGDEDDYFDDFDDGDEGDAEAYLGDRNFLRRL